MWMKVDEFSFLPCGFEIILIVGHFLFSHNKTLAWPDGQPVWPDSSRKKSLELVTNMKNRKWLQLLCFLNYQRKIVARGPDWAISMEIITMTVSNVHAFDSRFRRAFVSDALTSLITLSVINSRILPARSPRKQVEITASESRKTLSIWRIFIKSILMLNLESLNLTQVHFAREKLVPF